MKKISQKIPTDLNSRGQEEQLGIFHGNSFTRLWYTAECFEQHLESNDVNSTLVWNLKSWWAGRGFPHHHRISKARKEKGGGRHFFHQTEPN